MAAEYELDAGCCMTLLSQIERLISCMRLDNERDFQENNERIRKSLIVLAHLMREKRSRSHNLFHSYYSTAPTERTRHDF